MRELQQVGVLVDFHVRPKVVGSIACLVANWTLELLTIGIVDGVFVFSETSRVRKMPPTDITHMWTLSTASPLTCRGTTFGRVTCDHLLHAHFWLLVRNQILE